MYLPRALYEVLPYAYVVGGAMLGIGSYRNAGAPWSDLALVVGIVGVVGGLVLVLRRRSARADAEHYDSKSLDE